nr:alpha/beta hydrolase [Marivita sp. S6314]
MYLDEYDAAIRWLDIGTGDPILFLPGLSMPVAPGFAAVAADPALHGRRCILLDYLGSGQSDHPKGFNYALSAHAATIIRVLDHLGIQSIDVVGHSMGGTVGIVLALTHPDRVRRLIVGEGNIEPGGGLMSLRVSQKGKAAFLADGYPSLMSNLRQKAIAGAVGADRLVSGWRQADPVGIYANAKALVDLPGDFFDRFVSLAMPKSFVLGEQNLGNTPTPDTPDPERLKAHGIAPLIVADAGHAMMLDNHRGFMEVLVTALQDGLPA